MIKKAVLLTTVAPFLMVFSSYSNAETSDNGWYDGTWKDYHPCLSKSSHGEAASCIPDEVSHGLVFGVRSYLWNGERKYTLKYKYFPDYSASVLNEYDLYHVQYSPWKCNHRYGEGQFVPTATLNAVNNGGGATVGGGACGISAYTVDDPLNDCGEVNGVYGCYASLEFDTFGFTKPQGDESDSFGTFSVTEFNVPEYLNPLPGGCSDPSSCVNIGGTEYLVDWSSAPDYFSYVDSNGNVQSGGGSGGGGGSGDSGSGDTGVEDPTDPGGDTGGGSSGGGSSGGGSTVPDFEFDESGIIEAIGSAGRSNRNAINALSNDVTGAISNQTNELNSATSQQTEALTSSINTESSRLITETDRQTGRITTGITSQTHSIQHTLDNQTGSLNRTLQGLQSALVDAFGKINIRFSGGGSGSGSSNDGDEEGDGEGGFWDGLLDSLAGFFGDSAEGSADGFASGLEETISDEAFDEFDQQGYAEELFDSYESEQIGLLEERVEALLDTVDRGLSPYRNLISRLIPDVPTSTCTPIVFGTGHMSFTIDCEGFNLLKAMLAWVLYVFTAYTIVSTIFSYRSSAQQGA